MNDRGIRPWARETWLRRFIIRWIGYLATVVATAALLHFAYVGLSGDELLPAVRLEGLSLGGILALLALGASFLWAVASGVSTLDLLALVTGVTLLLGLRDHPAVAFGLAEAALGGFAWVARMR